MAHGAAHTHRICMSRYDHGIGEFFDQSAAEQSTLAPSERLHVHRLRRCGLHYIWLYGADCHRRGDEQRRVQSHQYPLGNRDGNSIHPYQEKADCVTSEMDGSKLYILLHKSTDSCPDVCVLVYGWHGLRSQLHHQRIRKHHLQYRHLKHCRSDMVHSFSTNRHHRYHSIDVR